MLRITFLFPGQGSQYVGMGKLAAEKSPAAAALLNKADHILGFPLSEYMLNGPEEKLKDTSVTQPALFTSSAAALELLKEKGLQPTNAAGHSLGEYSALYAAGVIDFETGLKLVAARGKAMQEAAQQSEGTMAAVIGLTSAQVKDICDATSQEGKYCSAVNFNSESQTVIAGTKDGVAAALEKCTAAGAAKVVPLNVAGAFHSNLMTPAAKKMEAVLASAQFNNARFPVFTNVDAELTSDAAQFKSKLVQQIDHPVLWDATLKKINAAGAEVFIEVGAGRVLSTMAKKLDRKKTALATDDFDGIEKHFSTAPSSTH